MKKFLLGTTAIVTAAAVTAPAVAAEKITLSLGGYMEQYIGYADNEKDTGIREFRSFDIQSDSEVWFQGSTTLDNGIKVAVKIEMETDGEDTGGTIDEGYLDISSASFGALRIGYEDPVTALMHNVSPNYGPGYGDADTWVVQSTGTGAANLDKQNDSYILLGQGDEIKISYFSPKFAGFQVGATYVPELTDRRGRGNGSNSVGVANEIGGGGDAWMAALGYANTFGGLGIGADIGYGRATGPVRQGAGFGGAGGFSLQPVPDIRDVEGYQAGLKVSFAGFEVGGAYQRSDVDVPGGLAVDLRGADSEVWEVGVGYKTGPWGVSVGYMSSEVEGRTNIAANDTWEVIAVSGTYNLGPGIDVHGSVYFVDQEEEAKIDSQYNDGGWAVVGGFKLAF